MQDVWTLADGCLDVLSPSLHIYIYIYIYIYMCIYIKGKLHAGTSTGGDRNLFEWGEEKYEEKLMGSIILLLHLKYMCFFAN
jgi:hypothetical protein